MAEKRHIFKALPHEQLHSSSITAFGIYKNCKRYKKQWHPKFGCHFVFGFCFYAFITIPRGARAAMIAAVCGSSSCFERVRSLDTKEKRRVSAVTPASSV